MNNSAFTFRITNAFYCICDFMTGFAFMAWSTASESTVLDLPDLIWSSRFLPSAWNFFNHLLTVLWLTAPYAFFLLHLQHYGRIRTRKAFVPKVDYFHIKHCARQRRTYQRTNYPDTTNHYAYLPQFDLLCSRDISAANNYVAKLLIHSNVWLFCSCYYNNDEK